MPVRVEKLPDEPIIILHYEGHVDAETVKSAFLQSAEIASEIDGPVYRISDVRNGEGSFVDLMQVIAEIRKGIPGSSADPRIRGVFVGSHHMARLYAGFLRQQQFGGTQLPFFHTLEDAFEYIRLELAQQ